MNTRRTLQVVAAVLAGMASMSPVAEGGWTQKADMPTARSGLCACVVEGKIYAIGGGPSTRVVTTTVEQYDPATDTWSRKADMRISRGFFGASAVNERIYVIGGYGSGGMDLASVEEYDPVLDTWTIKASMPTARDQLVTAAVGGKIYAIGGLSNDIGGVRAVEEYDPASDTWRSKTGMSRARAVMSCSTVDGIIYVIGGGYVQGESAVSTVEAYDPATDTWTTKAPMPTARVFLSTCVVNGKIFAIGGCRDPYNSSELSSVEMYDPATDTWTIMDDMRTARKALASAAVGEKIYAIGGQPVAGWDAPLATVEEYDLTPPPPDFNGDGSIDGKDVLILAQHWGQSDALCDIAPPPFGDGLIDLQDLFVLADHIGKEVDDPTLIAHWKLDETEGMVATDGVGGNDATLVGEPVWWPDAGAVNGALQFDGATFAVGDPVLDPSGGPFSVLAWVQGGAPGQVFLSQEGGANWLMADATSGCLMTELSSGGRAKGPLLSDVTIVDGTWHRVGLTWDGATRRLYVDDGLVADDTQSGLAACGGGLNIGRGRDMIHSGFFAGLIDDIRIYSRVVKP